MPSLDQPSVPPEATDGNRESSLPPGFEISDLSDVGRKREINEDSLKICLPPTSQEWRERGLLCVVADGMGGHEAGDTASWMAVHTAVDSFQNAPPANPREILLNLVRSANAAIYAKATELDSRNGMGTTLVAATIRGRRAFFANVGDSRAYILSARDIHQVTKDHSWVQEQIDAGHLSEEEAQTHPRRNLITRALGLYSEVQIDLFEETLEGGEAIVLCSDGLWGQVPTPEIAEIVSQRSAVEATSELIRLANERGGPDNITVIVVKLPPVLEDAAFAVSSKPLSTRGVPEPTSPEHSETEERTGEPSTPPQSAKMILGIVLVVVVVVLLAWYFLA